MDNSLTPRKMEKDSWSLNVLSFKANTKMIRNTMAAKGISMECTKENLSMVLEKDTEPFSGTTEKYSKENGRMAQKMDLEYGNHQEEIFTRGTGCSTDSMEKEFISIA